MNDERREAVLDYLRMLLEHLYLTDWHIDVDRDLMDGDAFATVGMHQQKCQATLRLNANFFARTPEQQRQTLTHELLHIRTARLCRVMTRFCQQDDSALVRYVEQAFDEEEEIVVDQLARVIAPMLPRPPVFP